MESRDQDVESRHQETAESRDQESNSDRSYYSMTTLLIPRILKMKVRELEN